MVNTCENATDFDKETFTYDKTLTISSPLGLIDSLMLLYSTFLGSEAEPMNGGRPYKTLGSLFTIIQP